MDSSAIKQAGMVIGASLMLAPESERQQVLAKITREDDRTMETQDPWTWPQPLKDKLGRHLPEWARGNQPPAPNP